MKRVRQACKTACLWSALALTACGGGGTDTTIIVPKAQQWRGVELSDRALAIVPGGGYALVGDVPEVDWLAFQTNSVDLRQASYSAGAWQTAPTPRVTNVHGIVFEESSVMARAGDWTVLVGRVDTQVWAQMSGPGGEVSLPMPLTSTLVGQPYAVVDASGKARVFWAEATGSGTVTHAMRFNGMTAIDDGQVAGMSMDLLRVVAGPDGKGWLFYRYGADHRVRSVDAVHGLGAVTTLNESVLGTAGLSRWALAESASRATTVALQDTGAARCVGVRRLDAGTWSSTHCANTDPTQVVGGLAVDLAVEPGGRALVTWSGGTGNRTLYSTARRLDGSWTAPREVVTLPSGSSFGALQTKVHTNGTAIVVYSVADAANAAVPHAAMFDASTETWAGAERFDPADGGPSARFTVAFNSRGEAGVLNFAKTASGLYRVRFAVRASGGWTAVSLQNDASLAGAQAGTTTSMQRLAPLGDGGWAAFWELTSNLVPGFGNRVVAAAYP